MLLGIILALVASVQANNDHMACIGPENLQLKNENGVLFATWSPIKNFNCYVKYKVSVYVNNILIKSDYTTIERFDVLEFEPCTVVKVQLSAIDNNNDSFGMQEETYVPEIGSVEAISFKDNMVSWKPPENFVHCTYEVTINNEKDWVNQEKREYDVSGLNLDHCQTHMVTITPIGYDLTKGTPSEISFETDVEIPNLYIQQDKFGTGTHAVWTDLGNACRYSVKVNNQLVHDRYIKHDIMLDELNEYDCRGYTIAVQAHGATRSGNWKELSYQQEPLFNFEGVSGVIAIASRFVMSMHWELDDKLKYCDISYNIMCSTNNGNIRTAFNITNAPPYSLEKCKVDSFTNTLETYIQPVYKAKVGRTLLCDFGIDYANGATFHNGCQYL